MSYPMSSAAGYAHENGDCWPSQCPACEYEDSLETGDDDDDDE